MNDLVSVIIPTYNRAHFVVEAVESVLCQTYPNIELIVVNDGSTDDTEEKLKPYMDRIIYIKKENEKNIGLTVNTGLRAAKGKYIARLDDDDLFMPDKTEKQVKLFEEDPDIGLVTSKCFIIDTAGRVTAVKGLPDFSEYGTFLTLLMRDWALYQPTVMVRRECHDKLGFYKTFFAEDYEMFLRISYYWKVGVIDQPLAKYRRHTGNITNDIPQKKEYRQDIKTFICDILDEVQLKGLFPNVDYTLDPYRESCAYAIRGAIYLYNEILDKADADFTKAMETHPDNTIPLVWLGISARFQEKFDLAEEYFARIQENDGLYAIARNARDLITAVQKSEDKDSSLFRSERVKEHRRLFRITYDGVSGKVVEEKKYRASSNGFKTSQYTIIIDEYPQSGKHLVFNTFTHAMINVGDDLKEFILNPDHSVEGDIIKNTGMLKKMGILVGQEVDETEIAKKWYNLFKDNMSRIHATILTTYDCNFGCTYCIEEGVKKPVYMTEQCADTLVNWLINTAEKNNTKQIILSFYGGEPLLNTMPIYRISEKLQKFAIDKEILMSSSIITNGSLLNSELLKNLARYGLITVKVTLDGIKEVHDARRPFKSGKGSFDIIIKKIQEIPETIKLTLQVNLDSENVDYFPRLLDFLEDSRLKDRIDNLAISPVFQSIDSASSMIGQELGCMKPSDFQMYDEWLYAGELMAHRKFKSRSNEINYKICSMNRGGAMIVIDPLGIIYSCPAFVGRESFSIGDIYHDELDRSKEFTVEQLEICVQCPYFPICGGGCRYNAYILHGDHTRIHCDREFIERQIRDSIMLNYDQKMNQRVNENLGSALNGRAV